MAPGRTRRDRGEVGTGHAVVDGDLPGPDVGDAHRDQERADAVRAAQRIDREPVVERADATEPRAEDGTGPFGKVALQARRQAGLIHGLAGGHEAELDVAVGPALVLAVEDVARIEVLHLGRDADAQPRRIE